MHSDLLWIDGDEFQLEWFPNTMIAIHLTHHILSCLLSYDMPS